MLGQMIETSLGATAMGHLTGLAEWVDLDGPLLISNDPFVGDQYDEHAVLTIPDTLGSGHGCGVKNHVVMMKEVGEGRMKENIQAVIKEVAGKFSDTREQLLDVEIQSLEDGKLKLARAGTG